MLADELTVDFHVVANKLNKKQYHSYRSTLPHSMHLACLLLTRTITDLDFQSILPVNWSHLLVCRSAPENLYCPLTT